MSQMEKKLIDFKEEATRIAKEENYPYRVYFVSKISPYFTYLFYRMSCSPNQVSLLSFCCVWVAFFFFMSPNIGNWLIAYIFLQLYIIIDCSDGELARVTQAESEFGKFLDDFIHPISNALVIIGVGVGSYLLNDGIDFISLSYVTAVISIILSLLRAKMMLFGMGLSSLSNNQLKKLVMAPGGFYHIIGVLIFADFVINMNFRIIYVPLIFAVSSIILLKRIMSIRDYLD